MPCPCKDCSLCAFRQVQRSVERVLADVKQKYDEAQGQARDASAAIAQAEVDLALIKQVQQAKLEEIQQLCK